MASDSGLPSMNDHADALHPVGKQPYLPVPPQPEETQLPGGRKQIPSNPGRGGDFRPKRIPSSPGRGGD